MASKSSHYQLQKLDKGDPFSTNGQQYTTSDREKIDGLLYLGAQGHHHTGAAATQPNPTVAPTLTMTTSQGGLPAGTRVWYKYTWVDQNGFETAGSPESFVDTPSPILDPLPPTLNGGYTGNLPSGGTFYAVSAYVGTSAAETNAANSYIVVPQSSGVQVTFPSLPAGATGWNVYKRAPGSATYVFMTSQLSNILSWIDDGSISGIANRPTPAANVTNTTNSVTVTVPAQPGGFTWNLYRTTQVGNYANSFLHRVVESPTTYTDTGMATYAGAPPTVSNLIGGPSQINLATEAFGVLPSSQVNSFPYSITFSFPGPVTASIGRLVWTFDFAQGTIVYVRAVLGRTSVPASSPVIVDVLKGNGANPVFTSIFAAATPVYPRILVGQEVGALQVPNAPLLSQGDSLTASVIQSGGGATPTDRDLTINVLMVVSSFGLPGL